MPVVRIRRRDGITQRYRVKPVSVDKYKRRLPGKKGKFINIDSYKRDKRGLGKKIRYQKIGVFEVAHDEKGNFRGSKVIPYKFSQKK